MFDIYQIIKGFVSFLLIFITILYLHRKHCQKILTKAGVHGPQPNWLFGNLLQMRFLPLYELIPQWTKQYGRTWGYYEGPTPVIVTADVDLLQEVFIKQFRHFNGRKLFPLQSRPESKEAHSFFLHGQRWKQRRSTLNPSFTESRMRQMFPLIDKCVNHMVMSIDEEVKKQTNSSQGLDIYKFLQVLTLDSICECAFGVSLNTKDNPNQNVIENIQKFFSEFNNKNPLFVFAMVFPEVRFPLNHILTKYTPERKELLCLKDLMKEVIKQRREEHKQGRVVNNKRVDLLQMLLDSQVCPLSDDNNNSNTILTPLNNSIDDEENENNLTTEKCPLMGVGKPNSIINQTKPQYLEEEEILIESVFFLIAGYETSSTALAYCCYHLVQNPQILAHLHDEIDSAMEDLSEEEKTLGNVNFYHKISQLPYLEAVIWETLRYHPFASLVVNRRCMTRTPVQIGNLTIPKNVSVMPDSFSIHFDEELWGPIDVNKFNPDRHLKMNENGKYEFVTPKHPMAMLSFGAGPRSCLGQRFALMEIRACLVRLLSEFTFEKCQRTVEKLALKVALTIAPADGVYLNIVKRKNSL